MANESTSRPELEDRIAIARDNIRQLTEQARRSSAPGRGARRRPHHEQTSRKP